MSKFRLIPLLLLAALASAAYADDLGGGKAASHGRVPRFVLESWLPGAPSAFRFLDTPSGLQHTIGILSSGWGTIPVASIGTLMLDPLAPGFTTFVVPPQGLGIPRLPPELEGHELYLQGLFFDPLQGVGFGFTDATRASCFFPLGMVGNSRQSSNSISVLDLAGRAVIQRFPNSENGCITFSPDRGRAYVCEPGMQRNHVVVYDLTRRPFAVLTTIPVSGGIRYRGAMARDGRRLYVPLHDAIAILDTDPSSPTYHREIGRRPALIVGNPTTIFTGPIDVAITPDMRRLFIAYGENLIYPAPSSVGVMDLFNPAAPERIIPITTGGAFAMGLNLATHNRVEVSPDGTRVYVLEFGVTPTPGFVVGFQNGALVSVIDAIRETEIMAIPTQGFGQGEFALDRMGRNLWIPQLDGAGMGQVMRIDVDRHSATRYQAIARIGVDPTPYSVGAGPLGVDVTPDGSQVWVSVSEDGAHPVPQVITIDARTNSVFGTPIPVESLCHTVSIQQR